MATRKRQAAARYVAYLRCSDDDQAKGDFTTLDTQRTLTAGYIEERGGALVGEWSDEGKTGTNLKRPGWKGLLAAAQAGSFDVVICTYMSRLGRGEAHTVAEWLLREAGVSVEYVKEKFSDDLAGYAGKHAVKFSDGMYAKAVSTWVTTRMEDMAQNGFFCGGPVPYGYHPEPVPGMVGKPGKEAPRRLVPAEHESTVVIRAFEVFVSSRSCADVQDYLRAATGRRWAMKSVTKLLQNRVYRGVLIWRDIVKTDAHPPIIEEGLWDRAQAANGARVRRPKLKPVNDFTYLLRGLVWCPHCGCRMTPKWGHGKTTVSHYYECISSLKGYTECPVRRVNAASLHEAVLEEMGRATRNLRRLRSLIGAEMRSLPADEDMRQELSALARDLGDIERRMARCQEAIETSATLLPTLLTRLSALEAERAKVAARKTEREAIAGARARKAPDLGAVCATWRRLRDAWAHITDDERAAVFAACVSRVEITEKGVGVVDLALSVDSELETGGGVVARRVPDSIFPVSVRLPLKLCRAKRSTPAATGSEGALSSSATVAGGHAL